VEVKGIAVNLMAYLNSRWARDGLTPTEATSVLCAPGDLMQIAGVKRLDFARVRLTKLAGLTGLRTTYQGDNTLIEWPKFAEFQCLDAREWARDRPRNAPSATSPATAYKKGAHAPVKRCSTYRSTPDTFVHQTAWEKAFDLALAELKAERDRDYTVAEIEERMAERALG
jgi:hypothetical protein